MKTLHEGEFDTLVQNVKLWYAAVMRSPDLDRLRSELPLTLPRFLRIYNEDLPNGFPAATAALLREFKKTHASLFRMDGTWSLDQHRKRVMDWLPARYRRSEAESTVS